MLLVVVTVVVITGWVMSGPRRCVTYPSRGALLRDPEVPRAQHSYLSLRSTFMSSATAASSSSCTTRSRTGLFLSYRESIPRARTVRYDDADDEQEHLISTPKHVALDLQLPPKWFVWRHIISTIAHSAHSKRKIGLILPNRWSLYSPTLMPRVCFKLFAWFIY